MSDCKLNDDKYIPPRFGAWLGIFDLIGEENGTPLNDPTRLEMFKKKVAKEHERCQPCRIGDLEMEVRHLKYQLSSMKIERDLYKYNERLDKKKE